MTYAAPRGISSELVEQARLAELVPDDFNSAQVNDSIQCDYVYRPESVGASLKRQDLVHARHPTGILIGYQQNRPSFCFRFAFTSFILISRPL